MTRDRDEELRAGIELLIQRSEELQKHSKQLNDKAQEIKRMAREIFAAAKRRLKDRKARK